MCIHKFKSNYRSTYSRSTKRQKINNNRVMMFSSSWLAAGPVPLLLTQSELSGGGSLIPGKNEASETLNYT